MLRKTTPKQHISVVGLGLVIMCPQLSGEFFVFSFSRDTEGQMKCPYPGQSLASPSLNEKPTTARALWDCREKTQLCIKCTSNASIRLSCGHECDPDRCTHAHCATPRTSGQTRARTFILIASLRVPDEWTPHPPPTRRCSRAPCGVLTGARRSPVLTPPPSYIWSPSAV